MIKLKENQFYEIIDGEKRIFNIDSKTGEKQPIISYTPNELELIYEVKVDLDNKSVTITEHKDINNLNSQLYYEYRDFKY